MVDAHDSIAIRSYYATGYYTKTALARMFNCTPRTISNILNRTAENDIYIRKTNPNNLLIMPYKQLIREWLSKGDLKTENVYQKLLDQGAALSRSTVARAVRSIRHELDICAIRYETAPGQQGQVDWGVFPGYKAIESSIEKPLYALFMILGYSRTKYVEFTTDMTCESLIRCIDNGLRYFGGTPKELLFDNMPQVVNRCLKTGNTHSPIRELNPEFTCFADYCGFDIVLARIRRPQEKGKVERFVGIFKNSFMPLLDKKTGHDISILNQLAISWCDKMNKRVHSTTGERPCDRLPLENLRSLNDIPFLDTGTRVVPKDGRLHYHGSIYQIDEGYAGQEAKIVHQGNALFAIIDDQYIFLSKRNPLIYKRKSTPSAKRYALQGQTRREVQQSCTQNQIPCIYKKIQITERYQSIHYEKQNKRKS